MIRVLLIEDDDFIAKIIIHYLQSAGEYQVDWVSTAGEALAKAKERFDVILLDILLPDADGVGLCERLRAYHLCPIIFISCLDDTKTIVGALEKGGDDYIVKPFDNEILHARIQANLRRARGNEAQSVERYLNCPDFSLDAERCRIQKGDETIELSLTGTRILSFLMRSPGSFYTAEQIYRHVWGKDSLGDVRTVLVHIFNLRKLIEADPQSPRYLKHKRGKGYYFDPYASESSM